MVRVSITSRIVLLIIAGALMILVAFGIIGRAIFTNFIDDDVQLNVLNTLQKITMSDEKMDLRRIQALQEELEYPIGYHGAEGIWQSDTMFAGWQDVRFSPLRPPPRHKRPPSRLKDKLNDGAPYRPPPPDKSNSPIKLERGWFGDYLVFSVRKDGARTVLFVDMSQKHELIFRYVLLALALFGCIMLLIIFGVRRLTRPIGQLTELVNTIGEGDFSRRVHWQRRDELGVLGRSVDNMAEHIEGMLNAKRDLLLAIAHELKTPLTRAKLMASLNNGEGISEELDEINLVLDQLLESERMEAGHAQLSIHRFNLSQCFYDLLAQINGKWKANIAENIMVEGDKNRLKVALGNILKNAEKYGESNEILVELSAQGEIAEIVVSDRGGGVPEGDLSRLGEAFTRLDPSRNRQTGGLGLGLYLTKRIINAHKGDITYTNNSEGGLKVVVQIPMTMKN